MGFIMPKWTCYDPSTDTISNNGEPDWESPDWKGLRWYCWEDDLTFYSPHQPGRVGYRLPLIETKEEGIIRLKYVLVLKDHDEDDYEY